MKKSEKAQTTGKQIYEFFHTNYIIHIAFFSLQHQTLVTRLNIGHFHLKRITFDKIWKMYGMKCYHCMS